VIGFDVPLLLGEHDLPAIAFVKSAQLRQGQVGDAAIDIEQD